MGENRYDKHNGDCENKFFTKNRKAAKASVCYITHRPGENDRQARRLLYGIDGAVTKLDGYAMTNKAK